MKGFGQLLVWLLVVIPSLLWNWVKSWFGKDYTAVDDDPKAVCQSCGHPWSEHVEVGLFFNRWACQHVLRDASGHTTTCKCYNVPPAQPTAKE